MTVFFCFFFIRSVQNGSNLIKLDFSPIKKYLIYKKNKNVCFIFDFLAVQNVFKGFDAIEYILTYFEMLTFEARPHLKNYFCELFQL